MIGHPRSNIIMMPPISYYTVDGLPIFSITIENQLDHSYWWGLNCWSIKEDPKRVLEIWDHPFTLPEHQEALDQFWYGFQYGHESPIFQSLIKEKADEVQNRG